MESYEDVTLKIIKLAVILSVLLATTLSAETHVKNTHWAFTLWPLYIPPTAWGVGAGASPDEAEANAIQDCANNLLFSTGGLSPCKRAFVYPVDEDSCISVMRVWHNNVAYVFSGDGEDGAITQCKATGFDTNIGSCTPAPEETHTYCSSDFR